MPIGILNVNAKDLGTGKEQKITITGSSGLSDSEIEEMVSSAESHAEEDRQIREKIETRNKLDNLVYSSEKILKENREKISDADAGAIEAALENARKASEGGNLDEMNKAVEELTQASHKLAEAMYQTAQQQQAGGGDSTAESSAETGHSSATSDPEDNVIDAEFVDSEEDKK